MAGPNYRSPFATLLSGQPQGPQAQPVSWDDYKSTADQNKQALMEKMRALRPKIQEGSEEAMMQFQELMGSYRALMNEENPVRQRYLGDLKRGQATEDDITMYERMQNLDKPSKLPDKLGK